MQLTAIIEDIICRAQSASSSCQQQPQRTVTEVNDDVTYAFGKRFVLGRHRGGAALDQTLLAVDAVHTAVNRQLTAATTTKRDVRVDNKNAIAVYMHVHTGR